MLQGTTTSTESSTVPTGDQGTVNAAHTPGPYFVRELTNLIKIESNSIDGWEPLAGENLVATIYGISPRDRANAALIVRSMNDRAELLSALRSIASTLDLESYPPNGSMENRLGNLARAAIARATGLTAHGNQAEQAPAVEAKGA